MQAFSFALHGGAGVIPNDSSPQSQRKAAIYKRALAAAIELGEQYILTHPTATPLDVCEVLVCYLEDCILFNAGRGSVYTRDGHHELEACLMSSDGKSGAVAMLTRSRNPVSLARTVAEHVKDAKHLVGPQAEEALHRIHGDPKMIVDNTFFDSSLRRAQWDNIRAGRHRDIDDQKTALDHDVPSASAASSSSPASGSSSPRTPSPRSAAAAADAELDELERDLDQLLLDHGLCGTVGAVCWHATRGCAAATSTGGLTNKRPGRLGDSSVIGASTYASADSMALSATGIGEAIAKRVVAYDVHARMLYGGASLSEAVSACLHGYSASIEDANLRNALLAAQGSSTNFTANGNGMSNANGNGSAHSHMAPGTCGVVAVSASDGQIVMDWNTVGMFRAARHVDGRREIGIWREDAQEL